MPVCAACYPISRRGSHVLKLDALPAATRALFSHLASDSAIGGFTLIGGTALSLQWGHRLSEDLDFWLPSDRLDKTLISSIIHRCRDAGFEASMTTPNAQIVKARINGFDLLSRAQDYVVGGVKVTFFARIDEAFRYFDGFSRLTGDGAHGAPGMNSPAAKRMAL